MTLSQRIVAALLDVDPTLKAELEVGLEAMAVITTANLSGTELVAMEDLLVEYTEQWAVIGRALNPAFAGVEAGTVESTASRQLAEEPNSMQLDEDGDDLFIDED